jgi:hypothetical protein
MNAESVVKLLEEMIDLKLQKSAEANLKSSAQLAAILEAKRETDRRRLEQIRSEMARALRE